MPGEGLFDHAHHFGVFTVVDQHSPRLEAQDKLHETIRVLVVRGKYVHVVPCDPGNDRHVRTVVQEFGAPVERGTEVLVPFDDDRGSLVGQFHHAVESVDRSTHQVVRTQTGVLHRMQDHGCGGRLAVRSGDHDAFLPFRFVKDELRIGIHRQSQFPGADQLRIVDPRVHPEDDGIDLRGDLFRKPAFLRREQTGLRQTGAGRFVDHVVRTGHGMTFLLQGERQVVHGSSSYGDKMNPHRYIVFLWYYKHFDTSSKELTRHTR